MIWFTSDSHFGYCNLINGCSRWITRLLNPYIKLYASIHNSREETMAINAGFKYFAWVDNGKLGKSKNSGNRELPKLAIINNRKYYICSEMRVGRKIITCTGFKRDKDCSLCTCGLSNVVFGTLNEKRRHCISDLC